MIKVNRRAISKPAILVQREKDWLVDLGIADSSGKRRLIKTAESNYNHKSVRKALQLLFHDKCAYCESIITHISTPQIDHYKPKSRYRNHCFSWNNLLLACGVCNSREYKGDKFPTRRDGGPIINPTTDDPSDHFSFQYDHNARLALVLGTPPRGKTTEMLLGLNRRVLLGRRSNIVRKLAYVILDYHDDEEAKDIIDYAISHDAEYSAFCVELKRQLLPDIA